MQIRALDHALHAAGTMNRLALGCTAVLAHPGLVGNVTYVRPRPPSTLREVAALALRAACVLLLLLAPMSQAANPVGGAEAARMLGNLRDGNRQNAIANLARSGQIRAPLSAAEASSMLAGTTQGSRAASIAALSGVLKNDLTGQEAAAILGSGTDLTDGNRSNAIAALARAKRFGPSIGGDAGPALNGATQGARATAIAEMAAYFRTDMRGQDVAAILGTAQVLSEGNRANAIAALGRAGRLPRNTSGAEAEMMLVGATQGARATAISEMATAFKSDLSGPDLALALGPATDLTDGNRSNAIAALARAKRFGPSIGGDAGPALAGATQGARTTAISEMAPYFGTDMRGQDVAAILGAAQVLSEGNRANAIAALARAGRMPRNTTGAEAEVMLVGTTQGARATAIAEMARYFADGLSGAELVEILGRNGETTEGNRYNAIEALARARRIGTTLSGADVTAVVQGTSGGTRVSSIAEIVNPVNQSIAQSRAASAAQPSSIATAPTAVTTASIDSRIARLRRIESSQQPELYEFTGVLSDISVVARDLPVRVAGFTDYRELSDQLYFASIQYAGLASHWIRKAQTAKINGDLDFATRCLDHASSLLQQRQSSYDAAIAAANKDLARATTYVRATYLASKWAAKLVAGAAGVPGGSAMVDAAGVFIDSALNTQEGGIKNATGQAVVEALTFAIIEKMPIPDLGGKTLADALQNQTGKILANSGVIVAVHNGIKDVGVRKVVIDEAKQLLAAPLQGRIEDQINAALDRLLAVNPATF